MKRLLQVLSLTLALNFLAVAGAVAWMYKDGRLDRDKALAIKEILFPKPIEPAPATQPASTQPTLKLEAMLAQYAGLPASEQLTHIRQSFDAQMVQLDRSQRSLLDLRRTVKLAQDRLAADRAAFDADRERFAAQEKQADALADDKGFQDTLTLYSTMPAKQVKSIFMTLDDATAVQYVQAMDTRVAAKLAKEFKAGDEIERWKRWMEAMRQPQAAQPPPQASTKD